MARDVMFKSLVSERRRIEAMLKKYERQFASQFGLFLRTMTSELVMRTVREFLQQRDFEGALQLVDMHAVQMANVIPRIFRDVASEEARHLSRVLQADRSGVAIVFEAGDDRAADLMQQNRLEFVQGFNRGQREATNDALTQALRAGSGTTETARAFRNSIGLTRNQVRAVRNYRRLLEQGSAEALNRDLRDRRFDSTVQSTIDANDVLDRSQVDRMTERYRQRALMARSEVISRTETHRIVEQSRDNKTSAIVDELGIEDRVRRVWYSTDDDRVRYTHQKMHGQRVRVGEKFVSPSGAKLMNPGDPSAPPEETIQCRCTVAIEVD